MQHIVWNADPVMLSVADFKIYWYGVLFAIAVMAGFQVMKEIYKKEGIPVESLDTLLAYVAIGILIGARLGHCLFYNPVFYLNNPFKILAVWEGGLASHGGGIGVLLSLLLYHRKTKINYLWLMDRIAIAAVLFGFFVRTANFINSEIIGVPSNLPWAIIFQRIDSIPRHPVQLYEAISYFFIFGAFILIYQFTNIKKQQGFIFGLSLFLVLGARFLLEFLKVRQAAYCNNFLFSTGQILSIPFFIAGLLLIIYSARQIIFTKKVKYIKS